MVSGPGLNSVINTALMMAAKDMYLKDARKKTVRGDNFEFLLTTDYEQVSMGSLAGMKFQATIESNRGKTGAIFIVRARDLERVTDEIHWTSIPLEGVKKAHLN
jgi:hypothetical protein